MPDIMNAHKSCKKTVLGNIAKAKAAIYLLKDMKQDNCPATEKISLCDLDAVEGILVTLRRNVKGL